MATKLGYSKKNGYGLSYSRLETLHSCPRKFEIENVLGYRKRSQSVTFAYGHMIGAGIQEILEHNNLELALFRASLEWDMPNILIPGTGSEVRAKKSFWYAIDALQKFHTEVNANYNNSVRSMLAEDDWEVAQLINDKGRAINGVEVSFGIDLPPAEDCEDFYTYEGHIDLLMYSPSLHQFMILELKTTGLNNPDEASYSNKAQALSYSIALDAIANRWNERNPDKPAVSSSYKVVYLVLTTGNRQYNVFEFVKTAKSRAAWLLSLELDAYTVDTYRATEEQFPMWGDCTAFFKRCSYYGECHLSNRNFIPDDVDQESFADQDTDFTFSLEEVINVQNQLAPTRAGMRIETKPNLPDGMEEL